MPLSFLYLCLTSPLQHRQSVNWTFTFTMPKLKKSLNVEKARSMSVTFAINLFLHQFKLLKTYI